MQTTTARSRVAFRPSSFTRFSLPQIGWGMRPGGQQNDVVV